MNRSNIKEANSHLQKLYQRVADLEGTVQEQAEALIRRDDDAEAALREHGREKDREIGELRKSLEASEVRAQHLMSACREKDAQISFLKQRSKLLEEVCQELPSLEIVVGALKRTPTSAAKIWNASGFVEQGRAKMTNNGRAISPSRQNAGELSRDVSMDASVVSPAKCLQDSRLKNTSRKFSISDDDDEQLL